MVIQRNDRVVCYGNVPEGFTLKNSTSDVILLGNYNHNASSLPVMYLYDIRVWDEPSTLDTSFEFLAPGSDVDTFSGLLIY